MTDYAALRAAAEDRLGRNRIYVRIEDDVAWQTILALLDALEESGMHEVAAVERVAALEEGLRDLLAALDAMQHSPTRNDDVAWAILLGGNGAAGEARALLAVAPSEPRCDEIVNNGMGEPTECGRTLPCEYHDPAALPAEVEK